MGNSAREMHILIQLGRNPHLGWLILGGKVQMEKTGRTSSSEGFLHLQDIVDRWARAADPQIYAASILPTPNEKLSA